jgi:hypothetical protein
MEFLKLLNEQFPKKKVFTVSEVAIFFRISDTSVKTLCKTGCIEALKAGGSWRIPRGGRLNDISVRI